MKKKKKTKKKKSKVEVKLTDDIVDDIKGFLVVEEKPEKTKKVKAHYIDNKKFFSEMVEWKKQVKEAKETGDPVPPVTEYIGHCFLEIAENLSKKPNFMNYPFKDEMVGDGIENCLMYCENFDPDKSNNPFSYFTQIIYYAFLRRIQKEKKQNYIKYKFLESMDHDGDFSQYLKAMGITEEEQEVYKKQDEEKNDKKRKKRKKKKKTLESFMED
jgi:hypothetical protein